MLAAMCWTSRAGDPQLGPPSNAIYCGKGDDDPVELRHHPQNSGIAAIAHASCSSLVKARLAQIPSTVPPPWRNIDAVARIATGGGR
jgi:hypothetical protein